MKCIVIIAKILNAQDIGWVFSNIMKRD